MAEKAPVLTRQNLLEYLYEYATNESDILFSYKRGLRRVRWTYANIARAAFQFARELEMRGIQKGDRIVILGENCPEWVIAFYGSLLRGVVVVPLDEQSAPEFVSRVFEQTNPKLVLYGTSEDSPNPVLPTLFLEDLAVVISHHSAEPYEPAIILRSDPVEIVFTSGTTAEPKGVRLTHGNILANVEAIEVEIKKYMKWEFLVHPLRILCLLPLSHVFGQMMGIFVPPLLHSEVTFQNRLNPADIIKTIRHERISVLATVPRVLETLRHKIEDAYHENEELERFHQRLEESRNFVTRWWTFRREHRMFGFKFWSFVTGGATLTTETERFWSKLGFAVVQGYGMTETAALISVNNPFNQKRGSLGEVMAGQEVKIGEKGEILVRGKSVSKGHSNEEGLLNDDEWLDTGDVGALDESGRLYFKGRKKDVIVSSSGLNIYPEDLEAALNRQPEIVDSAVFGLPGTSGEETMAALIVRKGSDAKSAVARANETLASHQNVRRWFVWSEPDFPRTPTQKIRKTAIADFVRQNSDGLAGKSETIRTSVLADLIAGIGDENAKSVRRDARLGEDLQLDSLSRTELLGAIEDRYQIDLDEGAFLETTTVAEVEEMIHGDRGRGSDLPRYTYPYWALSFPFSWFRVAFYNLVAYPITRLLCWVKVEGLENLESLETPLVFASNHVTHVDAPILMSAMPLSIRSSLAIAMEGEMLEGFHHPPQGTRWFTRLRLFFQYWLVIALFNAFPLPKKSGFRESFEYAGDAVDMGYNVLIYPEGELTQDGRLSKLQKGAGMLAEGLRVTVVPVVMEGLYDLKVAKRRFARPGSVTIKFGKPIFYDSKNFSETVTSGLEVQFKSLLVSNDSGIANSES